jgi:serine/threonine-protein kinase
VVAIYDRGEAEGTYYIAMEYLEGRSLKELIVSRGPAPIPVAIDYARQILAALRFAHRNGIVHRDIKPHNVLVDAEGRVKVTDFGIARAGTTQMTEVGSIIGTAQYLSPEQARGSPVDQTSDLYSVGIVLYELLTGKVPFTGDTPVEIAMKHISATPEPPSRIRPDVPPELDKIVLRALAKSPQQRYRSAEEMDRDLARVAQGATVSRETEEAATQIISRPTVVATPPPTPREVFYEYEEPRRGRPFWPWLLVLLLLVAAALMGWFVYQQIRDEISESAPVATPYVIDLREEQAVAQVLEAGLVPDVKRVPNREVEEGFVFAQRPEGGAEAKKGSSVVLRVSSGPPVAEVPDVVGESRDDAVAALARAGFEAKVVPIFSDKPVDTVTAQSPKGGEKLEVGKRVRLNVSKGREPVAVPPVVGQPYDSAKATLEAAGFKVAQRFVESDQPKGIVVEQAPAGNALVAEGTTVTLATSKGPKESTVPDVTSQDEETARATLEQSGFKVEVVREPTDDDTADGFVLRQDPEGGTKAPRGSKVTIVVAQFTP